MMTEEDFALMSKTPNRCLSGRDDFDFLLNGPAPELVMYRGICRATAVVLAEEDGGTVLTQHSNHLLEIVGVAQTWPEILRPVREKDSVQLRPYTRKQSLEIRLGSALQPVR
jgi:hypothetical protein